MIPILDFDETTLPWVDRASFGEELARRLTQGKIAEHEAELLRRWHDDGYVIIRGAIESDLIDALWRDYERAWTDRPFCRIDVEGRGTIPFSEAPPREQLQHHHYRLMDFHVATHAGQQIMLHPTIVRFFRLLFDEPPIGVQSLTFEYGTEQAWHQDFVFVNVGFRINSHLGAVWVACEDVNAESGPLLFYKGSHRIRKFDFGEGQLLCTADRSRLAAFEHYLQEECERTQLQREMFVAKKGDILFWHSALVHGGAATGDRTATRKSFVCHYSTPTAYPRNHWDLARDPRVIRLNGGMFYKLSILGSIKDRSLLLAAARYPRVMSTIKALTQRFKARRR